IPGGISRGAAPEPHRGLGRGEEALVFLVSQRKVRARRSAALDGALPELEPHVRGVPHHGFPEELRCGGGHLSEQVERDRRRVPGLSRPRRPARRVDAQGRTQWLDGTAGSLQGSRLAPRGPRLPYPPPPPRPPPPPPPS